MKRNVGRIVVAGLVVALAMVSLVGCAPKKDKFVTMRVGDIENVENLGAKALDRYIGILDTKSKGSIKAQAFHSSQLGDASKQLELVKSGTLEVYHDSISGLAMFDKGFALVEFPFLMRSNEDAIKVANSDAMKELNEKLAKDHGIRFIAAGWIRLPRQILTSKPVITPADLKNVKLRVPQDYSYVQSFKALGAVPTPVAFNEAYLALKQNVVNGAENHAESLFNMKWYEICKNLAVTDHSYDITGFIVNDKWWKGLTDEQRTMIVDTFYEVDKWYQVENEGLQQKYFDKMVADGVKITKVDKDAFRTMVYPAVMEEAEKSGQWAPGLFAKVQAILNAK